MKSFFLLTLTTICCFNYAYCQNTIFKYDNANRLIEIAYSDQKRLSYTYDNNGNRLSQITSTIVTSINNLNDSLIRAYNGVYIYPNPSNGNFKTRIYSSQRQQITVSIYSVDGKLIHSYTAKALKGYYDINININPKPATGSYIVSVIGKTIEGSKKILITD